jgi:alkylated DNA repair protein (DNA oxidative demethylase)
LTSIHLAAPPGFVYRPEFLSEAEERDLVARLRVIEFSAVKMRGAVARRRTAHFGWLYGYETWRIEPGPPIPEFLLPLRTRAAELASVVAEELVEVLLTEYSPGAGIGWHRDAPMFGIVAGISLLGGCRFRFERGQDAERETRAVTLAPRSAYLITGEARYAWRHSIPPMKELRYSVTFRTLRPAGDKPPPYTPTARARASPAQSCSRGRQ